MMNAVPTQRWKQYRETRRKTKFIHNIIIYIRVPVLVSLFHIYDFKQQNAKYSCGNRTDSGVCLCSLWLSSTHLSFSMRACTTFQFYYTFNLFQCFEFVQIRTLMFCALYCHLRLLTLFFLAGWILGNGEGMAL